MENEPRKFKSMPGDYIILGEMLGVAPDTARMRLRRNNSEAIEGLKIIVENRNELVKNYIASHTNTQK